MQSIILLLMWAGLAYAIVVFAGGLWLQRAQLFQLRKPDFIPDVISYVPSGNRFMLLLSFAPTIWLRAFAWPLLGPVNAFLVAREMVMHRRPAIKALQVVSSSIARRTDIAHYPHLATSVFSGVLLITFFNFDEFRSPVLFWLLGIWLGWIGWLAVVHMPNNSLAEQMRIDPRGIIFNSLVLAFVFGLVVPAVSAVIFLIVSHEEISFENFKISTINIYSLRGIVWKGPGNTWEALKDNPYEVILVLTGLLVFSGFIAHVRSAFFSRISPSEFESAALIKLALGDHKGAMALLRESGSETDQSSHLRAVCLVMAQEVAYARELLEKKFPQMREYGRLPTVSSMALFVLTSNWKLSEPIVRSMSSHFLENEPDEGELVFMLFLFFGSPLFDFATVKDEVLRYAKLHDYYCCMIVCAVRERNRRLFTECVEIISGQCSMSPSVQMLIDAVLLSGGFSYDSSLEQYSGELAVRMTLASELDLGLCEVFLVYFASKTAQGAASKKEDSIRFLAVQERLATKVSMLPHGAEIIKLVDSMGEFLRLPAHRDE